MDKTAPVKGPDDESLNGNGEGTGRRETGLGAGYDYQWDSATYLVLTALLGQAARDVHYDFQKHFDWLGSIAFIHFEGTAGSKKLEDITFTSETGRTLEIQVKEREGKNPSWSERTEELGEFMVRCALKQSGSEHRFLFLSNANVRQTVIELCKDPKKQAEYYNSYLCKKIFSKKKDSPPPPITCEQFSQGLAYVSFSDFYSPSIGTPPAPPTSGIGRTILSLLLNIVSNDNLRAYDRIYRSIQGWSYEKGGTKLTLPDLRRSILGIIGASEQSLSGKHIPTLYDELQRIGPSSDNRPSWKDMEDGAYFEDTKLLEQCEQIYRASKLLILGGGSGSGKTVTTRLLGFRAWKQRMMPIYWDFEHFSKDLPDELSSFISIANAQARFAQCQPMIILENIHLNPEALRILMSNAFVRENIIIIANSRMVDPGDYSLVGDGKQRFQNSLINLSSNIKDCGEHILEWYIRKHSLTPAKETQFRQALPWDALTSDLTFLRLALTAFDFSKMNMPLWKIEESLWNERLKPVIDSQPRIIAGLYAISGLGQYGLKTDLPSLSKMCNHTSIDETLHILHVGITRGLLSIDSSKRTVSYWHERLAKWYWRTMRMHIEVVPTYQ